MVRSVPKGISQAVPLLQFNSSREITLKVFTGTSDFVDFGQGSPKIAVQLERTTGMDTDALTLEIPGLTARPKHPSMPMDSSLDMLPDESLTHAQEHQDFFTSSETSRQHQRASIAK